METTLELWTMPECYVGEVWPNYYRSGFGRSRDSDCLEENNFVEALAALGGESDTVQVVREGHWAVGWIEWIAIHADDEKAIRIAEKLNEQREDYPSLNDDTLSERKMKVADVIWRNCYNTAERLAYVRQDRAQFNFHSFADMLGCIRGNYFAGYASELVYR